MKNFLDITAIDLTELIEVKVDLIEHHDPEYRFLVNSRPVTRFMKFGLLEDLNFSCKISKGVVEIKQITVNGYEIMPIYQHLSCPPTNWITQNWNLNIPGPFYPWYHQITGQGWIA